MNSISSVDEAREEARQARWAFVRHTFDGKAFGVDEARKIWGSLVPEKLPENLAFFSDERLVIGSEIGQSVWFFVRATMKRVADQFGSKLGNAEMFHPLSRPFVDEPFYLWETPASGWRLVSRTPIPGSIGQDYLVQTEALANYIRNVVYKSMAMPEHCKSALDEFEKRQAYLQKLMERGDWKAAAIALTALKLNKDFRGSASEALQRIVGNYENTKEIVGNWATGEYAHSDMYAWTNTLNLADEPVLIGCSSKDGIVVDHEKPDYDLAISSGAFFSERPTPEAV
jgi:hypothetical protein